MDLNGIISNFPLPEVAVEGLQRHAVRESVLEGGVSRFIAGHDKGVAFRFFVHAEYNWLRSKAAHCELFDEYEMIQWYPDGKNAPVARIEELGPELLQIDSYTGKATGRYAEAYERFKKGLAAPGTQLSKWGVLSDGEIATFAANGIYTVEQLAEQPRSKMEGKFPKEFVEYYERAIQHVNTKEGRFELDKQASEIIELSKQNAKLQEALEAMQSQMNELAAKGKCGGGKKKGRPRKVEGPVYSESEEDGESSDQI